MWVPLAAINAFKKIKRLCPGCGNELDAPKSDDKDKSKDKEQVKDKTKRVTCGSCGNTDG